MDTQDDIGQAMLQALGAKEEKQKEKEAPVKFVIKILKQPSKWKRRFYAVYCHPDNEQIRRWKGPWRRYEHQAERDGRNFMRKKAG